MKLDPQEQKLGYTWFAIAGTVAVVLSLVLYRVDVHLHTSDAEHVHAQQMRELRTAQTSLASRAVDGRQTQDRSYNLRVVTNAEVEKDSDDHAHH